MNGLGYLHFHGLGGAKKDLVKALDYFERAKKEDKDNENIDIHFNLGMVRGGGVRPGLG